MKFRKKLKFIKESKKFNNTGKINYDMFDESFDDNNKTLVGNRSENWHYGKNQSSTDEEEYNEKVQYKNNQWKLLQKQNPPLIDEHIRTDGFFCEAPSKLFSFLIFFCYFNNLCFCFRY